MSAAVYGREKELGAIDALLAAVPHGPAALVLAGEAGIGKTVLWETGVERARESFAHVLSYRGVEAEATLSFAGIAELVGGVLDEALPTLAAPRRRALEVALLLEEPSGRPPDPRAIALAFLDVLRVIAASAPVLLAVDDLQWVDPSSARILQAALRRLDRESVGLLGTARVEPDGPLPFELERSLPRLERVPLQPLSTGVLHHLLRDRLGLELTRPELIRLHDVTGGNPFFALEMGRELGSRRKALSPGRPLPVPDSLRRLIGGRLARLQPETREVLLTAAAHAAPTVEVLAAAHGDGERTLVALEEAVREGVLELDDSRVGFAHPLLASVCYEEAPLQRRRAAHRRLAALVVGVEEHARHLALAADGPNAAVASALDAAAEQAGGRGATAAAADLWELAAQLTPEGDEPGRRRRLLHAADFHCYSGDKERAAAIPERLLAEISAGPERADVLFKLASARAGDHQATITLCEEALGEAVGDDARSAEIMVFRSWMRMLVGDVRTAHEDARAGLERAERAGDPRLIARAIGRVAAAENWTLEITPGLLERGVALEERLEHALEYPESPMMALGRRLTVLGELDRARRIFVREEQSAAGRGDEISRAHLLFGLVLLEWHSGRWERSLEHADQVLELAEQIHDDLCVGLALAGKALVEADLGRVEEARAAAERGARIGEAIGDALVPIWNLGVLGHLELALGDLEAAARYLRPLPGRLVSIGWRDVVDPLWPDTMEALVAVGEPSRAGQYLEYYEECVTRSGSACAHAIAERVRGLLAASAGELPAGLRALDRALTGHESAGAPFELGRTLLAIGSVRRRARQKRPARDALEQAAVIFDELGASLWAARAREEAARIAGRPRASKGLTVTEQRVASLAADGRSNKEIAAVLFVSVHTVEAHLSRAYRKLGVRSRAELARRLVAKV